MWTNDKQINEAMAHTFRCLGVDPYPVKVRWSTRMTKAAGMAWPRRPEIAFSSRLWPRATEEQRRQIIIHETCHIIVGRNFGRNRDPHGSMWHTAMLRCGVRPDVYHNISVAGIAAGAYVQCKCNREWTSRRLVQRIFNFPGLIRCRRCKHGLSWQDVDFTSMHGVAVPSGVLGAIARAQQLDKAAACR